MTTEEQEAVEQIVRKEIADVFARIANRLNTGTPNLLPPIAQERVRYALNEEANRLRG